MYLLNQTIINDGLVVFGGVHCPGGYLSLGFDFFRGHQILRPRDEFQVVSLGLPEIQGVSNPWHPLFTPLHMNWLIYVNALIFWKHWLICQDKGRYLTKHKDIESLSVPKSISTLECCDHLNEMWLDRWELSSPHGFLIGSKRRGWETLSRNLTKLSSKGYEYLHLVIFSLMPTIIQNSTKL